MTRLVDGEEAVVRILFKREEKDSSLGIVQIEVGAAVANGWRGLQIQSFFSALK